MPSTFGLNVKRHRSPTVFANRNAQVHCRRPRSRNQAGRIDDRILTLFMSVGYDPLGSTQKRVGPRHHRPARIPLLPRRMKVHAAREPRRLGRWSAIERPFERLNSRSFRRQSQSSTNSRGPVNSIGRRSWSPALGDGLVSILQAERTIKHVLIIETLEHSACNGLSLRITWKNRSRVSFCSPQMRSWSGLGAAGSGAENQLRRML